MPTRCRPAAAPPLVMLVALSMLACGEGPLIRLEGPATTGLPAPIGAEDANAGSGGGGGAQASDPAQDAGLAPDGAVAAALCTGDADCSDGLGPICDLATGRCVQCLSDTHCALGCISGEQCGESPLCDPTRGVCVQCLVHADCSDEPFCDGASGECIECLVNSDCGDGGYCDAQKRECMECTSDLHCPTESPYCDVEEGECVQCRTDLQCSFGLRCDSGSCALP
ncbi:MAG: hypothetical protein OEZ06_16625 [Myxococcales bacterium]|nr:hypothetical protein [Myxococcales bacterium]